METKSNVMAGVMLVAMVGLGGKAMADDTLVRVQRITGTDDRGVERVLMQDRGGIVVSQDELPALVAKVNQRDVKHTGVYRNIRVELAADSYTTGAHGHALGQATAEGKRVVYMDGTLVVEKSGVNPRGLAVSPRQDNPARRGHGRG